MIDFIHPDRTTRCDAAVSSVVMERLQRAPPCTTRFVCAAADGATLTCDGRQQVSRCHARAGGIEVQMIHHHVDYGFWYHSKVFLETSVQLEGRFLRTGLKDLAYTKHPIDEMLNDFVWIVHLSGWVYRKVS